MTELHPCRTCPHVQYMSNKCGHPRAWDRDLTSPQTSHFPVTRPEWCPEDPSMSNPPEHQYITKTEGVCGGAACVAGTRISVATIIETADRGASPMDLVNTWPGIGWPALVAALQYALKHPREIALEIADQAGISVDPPRALTVAFQHSTVGGMIVYARLGDDAPWIPLAQVDYGPTLDTARTEREWLAKARGAGDFPITVFTGEIKLS